MSAGAGSETEGLYVTLGAWLTYHDRLRYREICAELGVDDFWVDYSTSHLHQMRLAVRRDDLRRSSVTGIARIPWRSCGRYES